MWILPFVGLNCCSHHKAKKCTQLSRPWWQMWLWILVAQTWGEGIDIYFMIFIDIPYILSNIIKLGCHMISSHIISTSTNQQILWWINISLHKTPNGPLSLCIGVTSWLLSTSREFLAPSPSEASCSSALRFMILKKRRRSHPPVVVYLKEGIWYKIMVFSLHVKWFFKEYIEYIVCTRRHVFILTCFLMVVEVVSRKNPLKEFCSKILSMHLHMTRHLSLSMSSLVISFIAPNSCESRAMWRLPHDREVNMTGSKGVQPAISAQVWLCANVRWNISAWMAETLPEYLKGS